jgi:hypothetical protein
VTGRFAWIALAALLFLPDSAPAQTVGAEHPKAAAECKPGTGSEVVVCGERERSPYRIDPVSLEVMRQKESLEHPDRIATREPPPEGCGTVRNECSGGTIPLLQPALRIATAAVMAAKGEDWREAFSNGPSDYDLYQQAKRKHSKVSVGISAGNRAANPSSTSGP